MDSADLAALVTDMTTDGWYLEPDDIEFLNRFTDPMEARQAFHDEYPAYKPESLTLAERNQ